jgi:4,5:9,10-diseco-3-hydroxy-5,9,17-trioxoandrosta-1(10),2-diene-4-oate hydrolase
VTPIPEGRYVELGDGLRLHLHDVGEGPAVLWLHGSGPGACGYSNFKANYPDIASAGFRCLVPDLLGYGLSSRTPDDLYPFALHVETLVQLLDALDIQQVAVVGNSMGGAMAVQLGLDHPGRVSRMVLMAPGGMEDRETYMAQRGIRSMLRCIFGPEGVTEAGLRKVFSLQMHAGEVDEATLTERLALSKTQTPAVFSSVGVPNLSSRVGELGCPMFVLWGMNDVFCPPSGAYSFAKHCANTRVLTLSECGHWVMVEYRDLFNREAVQFLGEGTW